MPSRKVNEIDNRGSSFYLGLYWAQALAYQDKDTELKQRFTKIADELLKNEDKIVGELISVQGNAVNLDGYFMPDDKRAETVMRPSETLNSIIDSY